MYILNKCISRKDRKEYSKGRKITNGIYQLCESGQQFAAFSNYSLRPLREMYYSAHTYLCTRI